MAMKTHPDKGGDPRVFKVITKSYMYLLDELNKRESNHNHNDMRSGAEKYMSGQSTEAPITLTTMVVILTLINLINYIANIEWKHLKM